MAFGPVRRAHFIGQSGVGGLTVLPGGISVITGSLDDWYAGASEKEEYEIHDWRLEQRLGVDHFRLPPDFRIPKKDVPNTKLVVPGHRFPRWHTCSICHRLVERTNPYEQKRLVCRDCETESGRRHFLDQVLIVACCENGHIRDFPWREWVHESIAPSCLGSLRLESKAGIGLTAFKASCDACGLDRNLDDVLNRNALSRMVDPNAVGGFSCAGNRAWEGDGATYDSCGLPLTGMVRNASNLYFPQVYSSLHLPLADTRPIEQIIDILSIPPVNIILEEAPSISAKALQSNSPALRRFSLDEIAVALELARESRSERAQVLNQRRSVNDFSELRYREDEHRELSRDQSSEFLAVQHAAPTNYGDELGTHFRSIALIPTLRETRAHAGFTRIEDGTGIGIVTNSQALMWKTFPATPKERWLPAYRVYGEGILFQLDEAKVTAWERQNSVIQRIEQLGHGLSIPAHCLGQSVQATSPHLPRILLIHSLAHALMREFVATCGYSAASLRERLYVSQSTHAPMASALIYTASGDSAGSMGGLVRLGEPEHLSALMLRALTRALWCAADPVCFDAVPETMTSTRESANLAACHNCMFVPETSCEEFNGLLDRSVLVGTDDNPSLGFFADLVR